MRGTSVEVFSICLGGRLLPPDGKIKSLKLVPWHLQHKPSHSEWMNICYSKKKLKIIFSKSADYSLLWFLQASIPFVKDTDQMLAVTAWLLIYLLIFQHILTAGGCSPSRSEYDPSVPSPHCGTCLHLSAERSVFALPWLIIQLIFLKTEAQRQSWHHKMDVRASVCLSESAQLELRYSQQWAFIDDGRSDLVELEADCGSYFNKERI